MFQINDDLSINITRGDTAVFTVNALNEAGENYLFQKGDVIRIKVTEKKACENVMFQKDFVVEEETEQVEILLTEEETKIGEVISKPTDYWYEVELNPLTNPQTIIGYDEDGAKILRLYPEGNDIEPVEPTPEDIPVVDEELDITSERPVQNHVIARAILNLQEEITKIDTDVNITSEDLEPLVVGIEENKSNIAKNKGNIEDLISNVEELNAHTTNTSNPHNVTAEQISYDNSISGMNASNVQGAIDDVVRTIGYTRKNLLENKLTTQTSNNVTLTVNTDKSISLSGTATGHIFLDVNTSVTLDKGTYIFSGFPINHADSRLVLQVGDVYYSLWHGIDSVEFTLDEKTTCNVFMVIQNGTPCDNTVIKPMIRPASIEDDTYEPYVPSVDGDFGVWTPNAKEAPADRNYYIKTKNMLHIWFTIVPNTAINTSNASYNLCLDVKKTFGIKNFKDAFTLCYASNDAIIKVFASSGGNVISLQRGGTDVSTAYAIYGQITLYIE